jgi:L-aspartate oxidase
VTSSGLHGANRLASNSLLEGLVYGAHAGRGASSAAKKISDSFQALPISCAELQPPAEPLDLVDIRNSLKSLMGRAAGVRRNRGQLADAARDIERWCQYVLHRQFSEPSGWELENMLLVARLVVGGALAREESRGVHLRTDFPELDDVHWRRHLTWRRESSAASNLPTVPAVL